MQFLHYFSPPSLPISWAVKAMRVIKEMYIIGFFFDLIVELPRLYACVAQKYMAFYNTIMFIKRWFCQKLISYNVVCQI